MTKLLQLVTAGNGFSVALRVAPMGSPEVWFQSANVSQTARAFEFSPRVNSLGDVVWAAAFGTSSKDSLSNNEVYFNGRIVASGIAVQDLALTDNHLAWISTTGNRTQITFFDLLTEEIYVNTVEFAADRIRVCDGQFVMVGLDTGTGDVASAILTPYRPPDVTWHGGSAIQLTGPNVPPMVMEIDGDPAAMALINAMSLIYDDSQEALALVTEDTGRVNNQFVPRLEALVALAKATGDAELEARAAGAALDAIRQLDENGVSYTTRYSLGDTPAAWSMHAAMLNGIAMAATDWMSAEERDEVIVAAVASFAFFEADWVDGAYLITPHSGVDFDGIIQPNNMQAAMGTFALQLYEATGEQRYLDRANAIFDLLAPELFEYQGTNVFYYWGQQFRAGWEAGQFDSDSRPTYPAGDPSLYDDVYHAALVIRFFEDIARVRGEAPLLDATALFDLVQLAPYEFSGFLNGGPSGLDWLPPWASADQMLELATRPFPTTLGVYDEGMHISAIAGAAARLAAGGVGALTVTLRNPVTWEIIETRTLTGTSAIVDWVQGLETAYAPAPAGDVMFGTETGDALDGSPDADVIRGLGGDDVILLGDGADSGFGDLGHDRIDGGAGDDTLAGGAGDDELAGGEGADELYGQGGQDALVGGAGDDLLAGGDGADELDGGEGADQLFGGADADTLEGGAGTDRLHGGGGNDWLDAGVGVAGEFQYLYGDGGDDTYVYGTASGLAYIHSSEGGGNGTADRVIFTDLNLGDVTFGWQDYRDSYPAEGLALMILWSDERGSGQLQIANEGRHIEAFQFADGSVFNTLQVTAAAGGVHVSAGSGASADLILGGAGTDSIYGGDGNDRLDAGLGVTGQYQYLYGEGGDDTYVYGTASRLVYINSSEGMGAGTADRVVFTDLNVSELTLGHEDYRSSYPAEGLALVIRWSNAQGSGELQVADEGRHIEIFQFADGTVFNTLQLTSQVGGSHVSGATADLIMGGAGTDRIHGGDGDDRLDAGTGIAGQFQYLFGEGGNDTYVYDKASGLVYISSSEGSGAGGADRVVFTDLNIDDVTFGWQDYREDYPAEGLALMIQWSDAQGSGQVQIANEGRHIEIFQFADGTIFTSEQLLARIGGSSAAAAATPLSANLRNGETGSSMSWADTDIWRYNISPALDSSRTSGAEERAAGPEGAHVNRQALDPGRIDFEPRFAQEEADVFVSLPDGPLMKGRIPDDREDVYRFGAEGVAPGRAAIWIDAPTSTLGEESTALNPPRPDHAWLDAWI